MLMVFVSMHVISDSLGGLVSTACLLATSISGLRHLVYISHTSFALMYVGVKHLHWMA